MSSLHSVCWQLSCLLRGLVYTDWCSTLSSKYDAVFYGVSVSYHNCFSIYCIALFPDWLECCYGSRVDDTHVGHPPSHISFKVPCTPSTPAFTCRMDVYFISILWVFKSGFLAQLWGADLLRYCDGLMFGICLLTSLTCWLEIVWEIKNCHVIMSFSFSLTYIDVHIYGLLRKKWSLSVSGQVSVKQTYIINHDVNFHPGVL